MLFPNQSHPDIPPCHFNWRRNKYAITLYYVQSIHKTINTNRPQIVVIKSKLRRISFTSTSVLSTYSTRFGDSSTAEPTHPSIHLSSPLSASIKSTYRFRAEGTGNTLMPCGNWAPSRNWSRIANLPKGSRINQRIRRS